MKLFEVVEHRARPTTEVLLIYPFKQIWERDETWKNSLAVKEFTYIEFMVSPKKTNPFYGYASQDERSKKIIQNLFEKDPQFNTTNNQWQPDILVNEAIEVYRTFLSEASVSLSFLESAKKAQQALQDFFNNVDLDARSPTGALLYKPKDITNALADTEKVIKTLNNLGEKVEQELLESTRTRNSREIGHFERRSTTNNNQ